MFLAYQVSFVSEQTVFLPPAIVTLQCFSVYVLVNVQEISKHGSRIWLQIFHLN